MFTRIPLSGFLYESLFLKGNSGSLGFVSNLGHFVFERAFSKLSMASPYSDYLAGFWLFLLEIFRVILSMHF